MPLEINFINTSELKNLPLRGEQQLLREAQYLIDLMRKQTPYGATGALQRSFRVETRLIGENMSVRIVSEMPYAKHVYEDESGEPWKKWHVYRNELGKRSFLNIGREIRKKKKKKKRDPTQRNYRLPQNQLNYNYGLNAVKMALATGGEQYVADYPQASLDAYGGINKIIANVRNAILD